MLSDRELVDAVLAGDKARFAELVRRYEPVVQAAGVAVVRDAHLAQDVTQEAFLTAYRKLGSLRDRSRFGPWILKIARREAYRSGRRQNRVERTLCASSDSREQPVRYPSTTRTLVSTIADTRLAPPGTSECTIGRYLHNERQQLRTSDKP